MAETYVVIVIIDGETTAHGPFTAPAPAEIGEFVTEMRERLQPPDFVVAIPVNPATLAGVREAHPDALI
jgi:hypothetical protein